MVATLRPAQHADLTRLTEIYDWYVERSDATFDDTPATISEREQWFAAHKADGPHQLLVAEISGSVAGYASSSPYCPHPAFSTTVETSIYLDPAMRGQGLGRHLYGELLHRLASQPVHLVVAGVALPNPASLSLHRSLGFLEVGTFTEYAVERGRRTSSTWFERLMYR